MHEGQENESAEAQSNEKTETLGDAMAEAREQNQEPDQQKNPGH